MVVIARTSTFSALLGASSPLAGFFVHSLYRTYLRPKADGKEIVRVSHYFICFWAVWAGCWSTIVRISRLIILTLNF